MLARTVLTNKIHEVSMAGPNHQEKLIKLAIEELSKVLQDVKQGKTPTMPPTMQKLADDLEVINNNHKNMSEEEIKNFAEKLIQNIENLEE